MRPIRYQVPFLSFVIGAVFLAAGSAQAAPQIVAAVPTNDEVGLVCAGGECSAEFSAICLQKSRVAPDRNMAYVLHGPDRAAIAITGHRKAGGTVALAPEQFSIASLRGHSEFRISVPAAFPKRHGLVRLSLRIERLAMLVPVSEPGDLKPQTADDVALAFRQIETTGSYWTEMNPENLSMARLTNRIINRLPSEGSVSVEVGEALWRQAAAPEKELTRNSLAWNRSHFDYCRKNALAPGGFSMRRCLGISHDWFMKDLNVNYWKSLKPTS